MSENCKCQLQIKRILHTEKIILIMITLTSPSVLPALKDKGSKNPNGADSPARPSADMDTLAKVGRANEAGRKATAEAAREATIRVWNILIRPDLIICGKLSNFFRNYLELHIFYYSSSSKVLIFFLGDV
jgi:hypothetical protein